MKTSLELKLSQQLAMTPQLQQAIKLLQLSSLDLQLEINQMIENNPLLELEEDNSSEENAPEEKDIALAEYEGTWNEQNQNPKPWQGDNDLHFDNRPADAESLQDYLMWQLQLSHVAPDDFLIAEFLIESIDDDGYLTSPLEEIAHSLKQENLNYEIEKIEAVLQQVQNFDPVGIGARSLNECLIIQAKKFYSDHPYIAELTKIITSYLKEVSKHQQELIAKKIKLPLNIIQELIQIIQSLNPKPGSEISNTPTEYIIPDAYVNKENDTWTVRLNFDYLPHIQVTKNYEGFLSHAKNSQESKYFKNQLQEAKWFIKSLENRQDTLKRVILCIVKRQQQFLEHGEEAMQPMILSNIANELELHESTISRATTKKYIHTPRGIFELKYFFSGQIATASGDSCSATAIRAIIKRLIAEESSQKPLSDSQLASLLTEKGIKIARRTVAKYRENLGIPPSHERKQHA